MSEDFDDGLDQAAAEVVHGFSDGLLRLIGINAVGGILVIFVALEVLR